MNKHCLTLMSALWLAGGSAMAQYTLQPDTVLLGAATAAEQYATADDDDASDFTFTESQLDEDMDAAQTVSSVSASNNDPYLSEVGFLWSAMRFRVRAYDNIYNTSYLNGLAFNDLETGRFNYSLLGGLNDATRNKEGASAFDNNNFGVAGIGGAENTNLRASRFAQGNKFTLSACNRNYRYRAMYTFASGLMSNGWAFAGTVGYRGATEGVIEGTFYNSASYLLSLEKRFGTDHSLSLVTFGAPTERAQQGASTEEAYVLAGTHYYNPNWGYQGGKKRNSRVVNDYEPTTILTWDWKISETSDLVTNIAYKHANYSSSALGWAGEAYDPRPDYYKNLPSSTFNVYDPGYFTPSNDHYLQKPENAFLMQAYNSLTEHWQTKANRQVNWDRMYFVNRQSEAQGGEALYYQERRHNDQRVWALSTTWNKALTRSQKLTAGVQYNHTLGLHYKTMADLLGGSRYTDVDKFAAGDYGLNSIQAQSDLRNPNRKIKVDDKFGYDYETTVNFAQLWAQYKYSKGAWTVNAALNADYTTMQREGKMQNGQGMYEVDPSFAGKSGYVTYDGITYFDNSLGKSARKTFAGVGVKGQASWRPGAGHVLSVGGGYQQKAPLVRNAFVAPRVQNNYARNLKNEDILFGEAAYTFRFGNFSGKVSGYFTQFSNGVEQTAFFNDAYSAFTYLTMSNVSRQHTGVELALNYQITSALSVHAIGTYGDAKYTNNPYAELTTEGMNSADNEKVNYWENAVTGKQQNLLVAAEDMKVGGTPLTALNFGANYNVSGWFFEVNANLYDRIYLPYSQYRRLTNIMTNYKLDAINAQNDTKRAETLKTIREEGGIIFDGNGRVASMTTAPQEKFDAGFMLDASIGKFIRLPHSRTMSINLSLQNMTNNTNLRTGGYEQNRDDNYYNTDGSQGNEKAYKFSKNPKYYYANAFNFFLNVNYKF